MLIICASKSGTANRYTVTTKYTKLQQHIEHQEKMDSKNNIQNTKSQKQQLHIEDNQ